MPDQAKSLTGKVALVTGAGRNIGLDVAKSLCREGATTIINVRSDQSAGNSVLQQLVDLGAEAHLVVADLSYPEGRRQLIEEALRITGGVDILVNNAGVRPHQNLFGIRTADWEWVTNVGLTAPFELTQAFLHRMMDRRWGRIINISGRDGFTGMKDIAHGCSTKAAIHGFTKAVALEAGPFGITVNTVVPGVIDTERPEAWHAKIDYHARAAEIPLRRIGRTSDIADMCIYLCIFGGFISGQAIHINGGEFLGY